MTAKSQHVIRSKDGWSVRSAGSVKATRLFTAQNDAIEFARQLARKHAAELYVHSMDGSIRSRDSYADVALPAKG